VRKNGNWRWSWPVHPARQRPLATLAVSFALILIWSLVYLVTQSWGYVLLAIILLLVSLSQFFLPVTFRVVERGVRREFVGQVVERSWSEVRRIIEDRNGVLLSPFARPSWLDSYRGLYLRFADRRQEIMEYVRKKAQ